MEGKIVSYDSSRGVGKIIIPQVGVKVFEIDNWIDYNNMPQVGMEVTFDENIKNIKPKNSFNDLDILNTPIKYQIPYSFRIRETKSLNDCLRDFFHKYTRIVEKYQEYLHTYKTLPYQKVKRFVFTAYNNLIEIDMHINDKNLLLTKESLEEIERYYQSVLAELKNPPDIMLEKIFLNKQTEYVKTKNKFEINKKIISENMSKAKGLESQIKVLQTELSGIKNKKSEEFINKEKELKTYKKTYVDLIDQAQNLKDENSKLAEELAKFKEFYKALFIENFKSRIDLVKQFLLKELNAITYKFDTILWQNAKKSKAIEHFFKEAKIEGNYSTKTFMKYYLKNLNSEKMNQKDAELVEVLNELKLFSKHILIFDRNKNRARETSTFIENLDHDNDVKIFDNIKEFVLYIKDNDSNIDIAIIEIEQNTKPIIDKILPFLEKIGVNVLFFSDGLKDKPDINQLYKQLKEII